MSGNSRHGFRGSSALLAAILVATTVVAQELTVRPGGIVRWPGEDLTRCGMSGDKWDSLDGACWYPIDLEAPEGTLELGRWVDGVLETTRVRIGPYPYEVQRITIEDESKVFLSDEDLARVRRENARIGRLWAASERPRQFELPLGDPLETMPGGGRFGARRIFNDVPRSPHSGVDYSVPTGTPLMSVADGRVALVGDFFFSGESVFIDHGGGLVSMYFHLSEIGVEEGEEVERGERIGAVGATGRATGPHLHFGIRWHGSKVDPELLMGPSGEVPSVDSPTSEE